MRYLSLYLSMHALTGQSAAGVAGARGCGAAASGAARARGLRAQKGAGELYSHASIIIT